VKRTICLFLAIIIVSAAVGVCVAQPARAHDRAAVETELLRLINKARTARDLKAVKLQSALDGAAIAHSREMVSQDYFSHDSAAGTDFGARLRSAGYSRSGYASWTVGEVIGWGTGLYGTAQAIFQGWMDSSEHRRVLLGKRWRDVGIGCAEGAFRGVENTLMYTVDFGRRVR
jgi:uncharacterized protein YkwD